MSEKPSSSSSSSSSLSSKEEGKIRDHKRHLHDYGPYSSKFSSPFALWLEKWYIRSVSIFVLLLALAVYLIFYPLIAVVALAIDLIRYSRIGGMNLTRSFAFFLVYMFVEIAGILMAAGLYFWKLVTFPSQERWLEVNYKFQTLWGKVMIFEMIRAVLGLRVRCDFEPDLPSGPKILFMRHVSFADTLIPQGTLSDRFEMRYILKKELLWDPGFNICGTRTPQFFLYREAGGEGAMDVEIQGMRSLVSSLTPNTHAIVTIWPEGTRFTPSKRQKVLDSLLKKDPEAYKVAQELHHTLLPRTGGALCLLEANKCADVLFCAHIGLEGAADFAEMINGNMCNRTLHIRYECVRFKDIPQGKEERIQWFYDKWKSIDEWIAAKQAEDTKGKEKGKERKKGK